MLIILIIFVFIGVLIVVFVLVVVFVLAIILIHYNSPPFNIIFNFSGVIIQLRRCFCEFNFQTKNLRFAFVVKRIF